MERIQEAAELCIEFETGDNISLEFVGIQKIIVNV